MKVYSPKKSLTIHLSEIKPGMILADNIFVENQLLLARGTIIKPNYIDRLTTYGIFQVCVYKQETENCSMVDNPIEKFYENTYKNVESILISIEKDNKINASQIIHVIENILEVIFSNQENMLLLTGTRSIFDTYYYAHAIDVCIYSLIVAKAIGLAYDEILTLGMGALLHDIGKSKVSSTILNKKGSLSTDEFEEVKKHASYGFDIVKHAPQIGFNVAKIIIQHHERCDGSGYPNHLKGNQISKLAKIVAIADIYDALTSDQVYKKKILPHEAAEYLLAMSHTELDWDITKIFLENIAIYPKGCQVLLNTNKVAIVTDSSHEMPLRPRVKILTDSDQNPIPVPYEFDLKTDLCTFITHIFN